MKDIVLRGDLVPDDLTIQVSFRLCIDVLQPALQNWIHRHSMRNNGCITLGQRACRQARFSCAHSLGSQLRVRAAS